MLPATLLRVTRLRATRPRAGRAGLLGGLLASVLASLVGCSTTGPESLRIEPDQYQAAFDAVVAVVRDHDMPAVVRDRRGGVIETGPRIAPSIVEPWTIDGASPRDRLAHTLALHRRRARFEFAPTTTDWTYEGADVTLAGPDVLGLDTPMADRTLQSEPLELRVWVYLEQSHQPGLRRDTWTRSATTQVRVVPAGGETPLPASFWTPVRRDAAYERRLLAHVRDALAADDDAPRGD